MGSDLKHNGSSRELEVPVIDLQGSRGERRSVVVQQIRSACVEWGLFQVINHDISPALMKKMFQVAKEFFDLPTEEKWKYSSSERTTTVDLFHGYGTKEFGTKGALDQGDQLRHRTLPLSARAYEQWPSHPPSFREIEEEFTQEHHKLKEHLFELISESLNLRSSFLNDFFGKDYAQTFLINHYLASVEQTPSMGLQNHSDICALTVLMQSVSGLQVMKDGEWVSVEPIQDAFAVNLGDQFEILTNGLYKSPLHRALLNSSERFSVGVFSCPPDDKVVTPIPELVAEFPPLRYKASTYAQYRTEVMTVPDMVKTLTPDL